MMWKTPSATAVEKSMQRSSEACSCRGESRLVGVSVSGDGLHPAQQHGMRKKKSHEAKTKREPLMPEREGQILWECPR